MSEPQVTSRQRRSGPARNPAGEAPRQPAQSQQKSGQRKPSSQPAQAGDRPKGTTGEGAKRPQPGKKPAQAKQSLHGLEALAALTVAESKLSRFKGRMILGLTILLLASLTWNSVQSAFKPEPKLLALSPDGRVQSLPLLDEPLQSRQVLMDWVRRNIPNLFNFNYANYVSEIQNSLDFTQQVTLERFQQDISDSGILSKVREEFLILRSTIVNEPIVVDETVQSGRRIWVVEIPMNLIYDSGEVRNGSRRRINQQILFTAWIARANVMEYDGGLMLAKYSISTRRE